MREIGEPFLGWNFFFCESREEIYDFTYMYRSLLLCNTKISTPQKDNIHPELKTPSDICFDPFFDRCFIAGYALNSTPSMQVSLKQRQRPT